MNRYGRPCIDKTARSRTNKKQLIHNNHGFTLLELLISFTLFSMLLPVLAALFVSVTQTWTDEADRLEAREQAEQLLLHIEVELRDGQNFVVQGDRITLTDARGQLVTFRKTNTGTLLRDDLNSTTVIGTKIAVFLCTLDSNNRLHLHLTTRVGRSQQDVDQIWSGKGPRL